MTEIKLITVKGEENISIPKTKLELDNFPDTEIQIAWELANLIRIAGTDYQCFSDWFSEVEDAKSKEFVLEETKKIGNINSNKSWIYAKKEIVHSTLKEYWVFSNEEANSEAVKAEFSDDGFYKYRIIKTYEYVSYYPQKLKVDMDRFGFIAERKVGDRRLLFIVFRGTREPSEWFNNAQFKQIGFLSTDKNKNGFPKLGNISLGFNKMYTSFRPGTWWEIDEIGADDKMRDLIERLRGFDIDEKSIHQVLGEFYSTDLNEPLSETDIYITGHSLGGALATIATMDIVATDQNLAGGGGQSKLKNPVNLYTFASPRVGDNAFADTFNDQVSEGNIKAYRLANSEDLVTKIPLPVWLKIGVDIDKQKWSLLDGVRATFNTITGGVFETDYQHVGLPIYFTHQARRKQDNGELSKTSTLGDNHNMTSSYCGALPEIK